SAAGELKSLRWSHLLRRTRRRFDGKAQLAVGRKQLLAAAAVPQALERAVGGERVDDRLRAAPVDGEQVAVAHAGAAIGLRRDLPLEAGAAARVRDHDAAGVARSVRVASVDAVEAAGLRCRAVGGARE